MRGSSQENDDSLYRDNEEDKELCTSVPQKPSVLNTFHPSHIINQLIIQ